MATTTPTTDDRDRGLYPKFGPVTRTDGSHLRGRKHHRCRYFVLDATHDPFAAAALAAYADACRAEYPLLAADIDAELAAASAGAAR